MFVKNNSSNNNYNSNFSFFPIPDVRGAGVHDGLGVRVQARVDIDLVARRALGLLVGVVRSRKAQVHGLGSRRGLVQQRRVGHIKTCMTSEEQEV